MTDTWFNQCFYRAKGVAYIRPQPRHADLMKVTEINKHVLCTLRPAPASQSTDQLWEMRVVRTFYSELKVHHTHSFSIWNRRTKAHYLLLLSVSNVKQNTTEVSPVFIGCLPWAAKSQEIICFNRNRTFNTVSKPRHWTLPWASSIKFKPFSKLYKILPSLLKPTSPNWCLSNTVCHLKCNPKTITYYNTKIKSEAGLPPCNRFAQSPRDPRVNVTLVARPLLTPVAQKLCGANMVYLRVEHVFILEYYFASKSFAAVRKAFSNAYPVKQGPNKATRHRLVTQFRDAGNVCLREVGEHLL
jgi:hypothetical protein